MRVLDTLSILLARIVLLGNGEVHEKTYTFIAVNLEAFKMIALHDACIRVIPT